MGHLTRDGMAEPVLWDQILRRVFDDTSYFVTVGLSNAVQLRWLGKYSVMLELLESLLCCLTRHSFFFRVLLLLSCSPSSFSSSVLFRR